MLHPRPRTWARLALAGLLALALGAARGLPVGAPPEEGIELTFLANEGFLVRSPESALLIDAFVPTPYSIYGGLSDEAREALGRGAAPFDEVELVLVSHYHRDHWEPEFARRSMLSLDEARLVTSPQVLEQLDAAGPVVPDRARELLPEAGEREVFEVGALRVEAFRLSHGSGRTAAVQNVAHLIEVGGLKVLHMGDADPGTAKLAPFELAREDIDVALVPYWWLVDDDASATLRAQVAPRDVVAVHVPPAEVEGLREALRERWPAAHVFADCLETRHYTPRVE